jgi:demethylmenaquinone methyltransferase/2-methoxy-6-polyprenyl-1,4-benzoquinol methylase/ArsR family transcriptional regulator
MSDASSSPWSRETLSFGALLGGLEAAAEVTRLRLLGLLCEAELTVSELVAILGQSQPRISRHLKLLVEAGFAERQREGAWAFFRLAEPGGALARDLIARLAPDDPTLQTDRARLEVTREARRRQAAAYFAERAADWDHIRELHAPEARVEATILALVGDARIHALLDLGTGTGRMLELIGLRATRATSCCGRATSTRRRSTAMPTISSSFIRCCTSWTTPPVRCERPRAL